MSQFSTVYTHKAHSPRNLRRLLLGTRTGYHSGDGRHWVRPHWLAASGQLGRSRLMTSRDRVLATTVGNKTNQYHKGHVTWWPTVRSGSPLCRKHQKTTWRSNNQSKRWSILLACINSMMTQTPILSKPIITQSSNITEWIPSRPMQYFDIMYPKWWPHPLTQLSDIQTNADPDLLRHYLNQWWQSDVYKRHCNTDRVHNIISKW